jgi:hypothetical protein
MFGGINRLPTGRDEFNDMTEDRRGIEVFIRVDLLYVPITASIA